MAIVLPLLLLLFMGMVDFGFMFQRFVVLTNAAAEGARVASLPGYTTAMSQRAWPLTRPTVVSRARSHTTTAAVALPGGAGGGTVAGLAGHRHARLQLPIHRSDCGALRGRHGRQRDTHVARHDAPPGRGAP